MRPDGVVVHEARCGIQQNLPRCGHRVEGIPVRSECRLRCAVVAVRVPSHTPPFPPLHDRLGGGVLGDAEDLIGESVGSPMLQGELPWFGASQGLARCRRQQVENLGGLEHHGIAFEGTFTSLALRERNEQGGGPHSTGTSPHLRGFPTLLALWEGWSTGVDPNMLAERPGASW